MDSITNKCRTKVSIMLHFRVHRNTVTIHAGAALPVFSSDDEDAATQNIKKRLDNLARAPVSRLQ